MAAWPAPGVQAQEGKPQGRAQYEGLIAAHAKANMVPEALVHRVIVRESKYRPDLIGSGGTIGLMQIKLATARGVGYTGDAYGLRDPDTNLAFGVKYLAGAYRAAGGDHDRAMRYYASGYYHVAKQQRLERRAQAAPVLANAAPQEAAEPKEEVAKPKRAVAKPLQLVPRFAESAKSKDAAAKPKSSSSRKLAEAKAAVPRPPAAVGAGAKPAPAR
ncbi:transglycosylase SLT domain-containing protein [Bradyrhizobium lablabi]|nr:lytic transglycosylase domain-containing protein [Bradyrhizobium lablabi]MBR1122983.1 transglycosylase SLT domain-containing protein [Bradyrhizobium lablabi]